ncbi:helix-turn-helix domain-containing protein [Cohnella sp. CFH 77786]|uniref:helix-turn-helix transcriptional regulator n=1 Tax=Cohnella sp. CFH 77786 TaxID=2662265 RepID=UPI001C610073|nr:AraC family transcriptional regulator [Cohnella sp. CFH 77786]MBW5445572.1 helix-turn-helix domain-containing protein [Cohnella sp. CFH 77786]
MWGNGGSEHLQFGYRVDTPIEPEFHSHPWYEVYYFHEGVCNYLIGDRIYSLSPGDLILMNGMTLHCPKMDPRYPYVRSVIHFEPSLLKPFLELPQGVPFLQPFQTPTNFKLSLQPREKEEVERLLAAMDERLRHGGTAAQSRMLLVFADLLHLIYELCRNPMSERPELPSEKESTVQRVVSYIEERFTEDLDMERLQADLHVSKFYLSRLFKEVTGVTIFDFVFQRRINEAKISFLLDPGRSVTDVCFQTGFKHLAHFSRLFKRQVGMTPETYRKRIRMRQG